MRLPWLLPLLFFVSACATPTYIVATANGAATDLDDVADDLAKADVVALGELHRTPPVHQTHRALIELLHERRGDVVIAMEMFERDTQTALLQYLTGITDEGTFLASARPWIDYARDYRPVIEYAKANALMVLAANAPRPLASRVAKEGIAAVAGNPDVARETTAPQDEYWQAFLEAMKGHPGATPETQANMYAAQCLKDDTMAETITDYLKKRQRAGGRPLVVLICGSMHSNYGRGTVARIKSRMPDLVVRVVSAEVSENFAAGDFTSPSAVGDYVVVAPVTESSAVPEPAEKAAATPPVAAAAPVATPPKPAEPAADENVRPALGLMPDYQAGQVGVVVASVREGGAAEKAGIEAGDVILAVAGVTITDVSQYSEVLDQQKIGKTIPVRLRRDVAEVELMVTVGSRPRGNR